VYVDLPAWARFWKRGSRGLRPYYVLWQLAALREARRLHQSLRFDIAWHITLANVWLGSVAPIAGPDRCIFGPVGGGVRVPSRLWRALGVKGALYELARAAGSNSMRLLNPLARLGWSRSHLILVNNPDTQRFLPARHRAKAAILPHAVLEKMPDLQRVSRDSVTPLAFYAGAIVPRKGLELSIRTIARLPGWTLRICGRGWDEPRLRRLADELGVASRIEFLGWVPREKVTSLMRESDVFLFPSLHDDAPFAVMEALGAGLPVACLDVGGPAYLGGTPVHAKGLDDTVGALAELLPQLVGTQPPPPADLHSRLRELKELLDRHGLFEPRRL
jgi:glycosyltransferase involved in cell wall biosynthesis